MILYFVSDQVVTLYQSRAVFYKGICMPYKHFNILEDLNNKTFYSDCLLIHLDSFITYLQLIHAT